MAIQFLKDSDFTGNVTVAGRVTVEATSAVTNGVVDTLVVKALSSGAITNGFGVGLSFYNENTVYSAVNEVGKIAVIETNTTAVDDKMVFFVKDNNTLAERLTLNGSEAIFTGNITVPNGLISTISGNNLTISGSVALHAGLTFATNAVLPVTVSVANDNVVDLGQSNNQFKNLYFGSEIISGGGATFAGAVTLN